MNNKRPNSAAKSLSKSLKKLNSTGKRSPSPTQKDLKRKSSNA